jgi:hypothetical protein
MVKQLITCAIVAVFLFGCNEAATSSSSSSSLNSTSDDSSVSVDAMDTSSTSSDLSSYTMSSFSMHVYFHNSEDKMIVTDDFFPDGSDTCSQATYDADTNPNGCQQDGSVVIPCEFQEAALDEWLSVSTSASDSSCEDDIVVDLSSGSFSLDGWVFEATELTAFADDFDFNIGSSGFVDTGDSAIVVVDTDCDNTNEDTSDDCDVKLEDIYEAILDKRTS